MNPLRRGTRLPTFRLLPATTLLFASTLCAAQNAPPTAAEAQSLATLHVTTRLVEVNVIVNDKHGNPITGLTQKDFALLDNGKVQEVRVFSAEHDSATSASSPPLPADVFTNRIEERTHVPASVTVILLDALNTEPADQTLAWKQVLKVLDQIRPEEYVALYWLGNELRVLHEFTTDIGTLREVLAGLQGKSSRQLDNSKLANPALNTTNPSTPIGADYERLVFRSTFEQRVANEGTRDRVLTTVSALVAIANHLRTRPGRKNLIWVSSSFPIDLSYDRFDPDWSNDTGARFEGDVARAAQALTSSDIAVYPVDARGLLGTDSSAAGDDLGDHIGDPTETDPRLPTREAPQTLDTMRTLAERTGGKAFYGTNGIAGAIRRAINDARVTYTLGYYPADVKWDGTFHEIKVKVAAPGAEVRARKGYFAVPDALQPPNSVKTLIAQLAGSRLPATGIALHVRVQGSSHSRDAALTVEVHLDLHEVQMQQKDRRWTGAVQSVFLQLDKSGRIVQADDRTFHPEFSSETYPRALETGISDSRQIRPVPGATELCVVVRDATSGTLGSIYVPLVSDQAK